MANWSEIPHDLVDAILNRLPCAEDFVRCGAVCSSWRSVTVAQKQKQLRRSFNPWLLRPGEEEKKENEDKPSRVCFSTCRKTKFRIELPEAEARKCLGSGYGWLMTLGLDLDINLLNPLSHAQISLPSQATMKVAYPPVHTPENMRRMFIERFAVSSTPSLSNQDFVVVVIYGGFSVLLFASPGDQTWTTIQTEHGGFGDVIYFNDQFYAVRYGELVLCEIDTPTPKLTKIASSPPLVHNYNCFLVEMSGYLHLVVRQARPRFEVYRFDFHSRKWTHVVDSIGDYALFLGTNASFSISTSDYPEINANSIYFTCDKHFESFASGFWITGVYNYQNKTTKLLYSRDHTHSTFCPPLLFMPAL